jgi:hypothetical protein
MPRQQQNGGYSNGKSRWIDWKIKDILNVLEEKWLDVFGNVVNYDGNVL